MNKGTAVVIDLAARRGKLPFALREQTKTTREQLLADCTEYLLNRVVDLEEIWDAEGKTPADVRMELLNLTLHSGLFGQAVDAAVELARGVLDDSGTAA